MSLDFRYELHIFFVLERSFRKAFKEPNLKSETKEEKNLLSRWGCQGALQIWERFGDGDPLGICGWGKDSAKQDCSVGNLLGLVCVVLVVFCYSCIKYNNPVVSGHCFEDHYLTKEEKKKKRSYEVRSCISETAFHGLWPFSPWCLVLLWEIKIGIEATTVNHSRGIVIHTCVWPDSEKIEKLIWIHCYKKVNLIIVALGQAWR